jgi:hypothetical protein
MTIQDKIAALPPSPSIPPVAGVAGGPAEDRGWKYYAFDRAARLEAERDLALEVLRKAKEHCTNCHGNGAYLDLDGLWNDCRYCDEARAVLAACGGESRE